MVSNKSTLLSPRVSLTVGFTLLWILSIVFNYLDFYKGNSYFHWGPPVKILNVSVTDNATFYWLQLIFFIHQLVFAWVSETVYPWIVNIIQDPKTIELPYSKTVCLLIVNCNTIYNTLNMVFIVNASISQISFLFPLILANMITLTIVNGRYINKKGRLPLLNDTTYV